MVSLLLSFFSLISLQPMPARDIVVLFKEPVRLENMLDEKAAPSKFEAVLKIPPVNFYTLNKCLPFPTKAGMTLL